MATIFETLATESLRRPLSLPGIDTLPGASAHFRLLVERDAHDGCEPAAVQGVALYDNDGPAKAGGRASRLVQLCPPDFALRDICHDDRSSASARRRAGKTIFLLIELFAGSIHCLGHGVWRKCSSRYWRRASL